MKRSEFKKKRFELYSKPLCTVFDALSIPPIAEARSEGDCKIAEEAGVVWEPEEEPLPEKVSVGEGGQLDSASIHDGAGKVGDYCFWVIRGHRRGDGYSRRVAAEAARRYNAWPELRHIAANLLDNDGSSTKLGERLLAILDGKEGA